MKSVKRKALVTMLAAQNRVRSFAADRRGSGEGVTVLIVMVAAALICLAIYPLAKTFFTGLMTQVSSNTSTLK